MARKQPDYFKAGDWNAICDACGGKFKASELKEDWRGFMMCAKDWEPRHPQDFVHGVPENMAPPWTRPRPAPRFVDVTAPPPPAGGGTGTGGGIGGGPAPPPPPPPPPAPPSPAPAPAPSSTSVAGVGIAGIAITGN